MNRNFEQNLQQKHPDTPASAAQNTAEQLWRSDHLSSRGSICHSSPRSDQSGRMSQLRSGYQRDSDPNFMWPLKSPFQFPEILVQHINLLVDTVVVISPDLTNFREGSVTLTPCRPLARCWSQPLIKRKQPSGFNHRHSIAGSNRVSHTHKMNSLRVHGGHCEQRHSEMKKVPAVSLTAGEENNVTFEEEASDYRSNEWSSSHLSPETKQWNRRTVRVKPCSRWSLSSPPADSLPDRTDSAPDHTQSTGLVYDPQMLKKQCICGNSSCAAEHAGRIPKVFDRLLEGGVSDQCKWITGDQCHMGIDENTSLFPFYVKNASNHVHTSVRMAARCVTELVLLIAEGRLKNGAAVVQPHSHDSTHLSHSKSGDSINPVAVAAKYLQKTHQDRKILILDWDVHHCNVTQEMFYTDPNVLHISLHHYGNTMMRGQPEDVGLGCGKGFNINVVWSHDLEKPIGDAEYLAAFRTVINPITQQFRPDVILISTEFNAIDRHPDSQKGSRVSAECFGLLTEYLMELSGGHVVLALQRGHNITAVCEAFNACVNALLGNKVACLSESILKKPCNAAVQSLHKVLGIHSLYWSSVRVLKDSIGELRLWKQSSARTETALALPSFTMTKKNFQSAESCRFSPGKIEPEEHDEDEDKA